MNDECIKEILIALINNGRIFTGADNKSIAENMALFIKTLKHELKEHDPVVEHPTLEELSAKLVDINAQLVELDAIEQN